MALLAEVVWQIVFAHARTTKAANDEVVVVSLVREPGVLPQSLAILDFLPLQYRQFRFNLLLLLRTLSQSGLPEFAAASANALLWY